MATRARQRWHGRGDGGAARSAYAFVAVVVLWLLAAQDARAGTYVMRTCDVPGRDNAQLGPWETIEREPDLILLDRCASGGGVGFTVSGPPVFTGTLGTLALWRSRDSPLNSIGFVKARLWYSARLSGSGPLPITMFTHEFRSDGTVNTRVFGSPGGENLVLDHEFSPATTNGFKVGISCGPPAGDCFPANPVPFLIQGMEVTLSEEVQPTIASTGGTLLKDGPQAGVRTLEYAAVDGQSGVARIDVLVGGTVVATHDLAQRCNHPDYAICPSSDSGALQIDTRLVPNGTYALALRARDAAANENTVSASHPIVIANAAPPPRISLTAKFRGTSRSTVTVPYTKRVRLEGRLTGGGGSGAHVEVLERVGTARAVERLVDRVQTGSDGGFSVSLRPRQPSRSVRVVHRHSAGIATSQRLRLRVRAVAALHATLHGRIIRFGGRVLSRPIPKSGKRIVMQGRSRGYAWATFASLRTNRNGRFAGRYRLPVRRPGVRLEIRATIPVEQGYGYVNSTSRTVKLRVR